MGRKIKIKGKRIRYKNKRKIIVKVIKKTI